MLLQKSSANFKLKQNRQHFGPGRARPLHLLGAAATAASTSLNRRVVWCTSTGLVGTGTWVPRGSEVAVCYSVADSAQLEFSSGCFKFTVTGLRCLRPRRPRPGRLSRLVCTDTCVYLYRLGHVSILQVPDSDMCPAPPVLVGNLNKHFLTLFGRAQTRIVTNALACYLFCVSFTRVYCMPVPIIIAGRLRCLRLSCQCPCHGTVPVPQPTSIS